MGNLCVNKEAAILETTNAPPTKGGGGVRYNKAIDYLFIFIYMYVHRRKMEC